jgi:hypothetical protein
MAGSFLILATLLRVSISKLSRARRTLLLLSLLAAPSLAPAQVSLSVSPPAISNLYSGPVTLQIAGLTNGEQVLVERFIDFNGNGAVDPGEPLNLSFLLRDGDAQIIGGVTNTARPFDQDGAANGAINTQLRYGDLKIDELGSHAIGKYLFRVSSLASRFTPVTAPFAITNTPFSQTISGRILGSGAPLSNAVALLFQTQPGGDQTFAGAVFADISGGFQIQVPPGTYQLAALKPGYTGSLSGGPQVAVSSGATVSTNLGLTPAISSITAAFQVVGGTNDLAGLPILALDANGNLASGFVSSNGAFNLSVNPGRWSLQFDASEFLARGVVPLSTNASPAVDTSTGAVAGLTFTAYAATALLYGNVHDSLGNPVPNAAMNARDNSGAVSEDFASDASGNYVAPVYAETYSIGPNLHDPSLAGYFGDGSVQIGAADGTAVRDDFTLSPTNSLILGFVNDTQGNPVAGLSVVGSASIGGNSYDVRALTATNGAYSLGILGGGVWNIGVAATGPGSTPLLSPSFNVSAAPQRAIQENFILLPGSNSIQGLVTDDLGQTVSGVDIYAFATLSGTNYSADTLSDKSGSYSLPVLNGIWTVAVNTFDLPAGYTGSTPASSTIPVSGSDARLNFTMISAAPTPSSLAGRVIDSNNSALTNITMVATNNSGATVSALTDTSGSFALQVTAGSWQLQIAAADAAQRNFVFPILSFTVTNGLDISGVSYLVFPSTARITGRALSSLGAPLAGILALGSITLGGTNYQAPGVLTAQDGSFSLPVVNGLWSLNLDCAQLSNLGYTCAGGATINISGAGAAVTLFGLPPAPLPPLLTLSVSPAGQVQGQIQGEYDRLYSLDATPTLQPSAWTTILTTNSTTNIVTFTDTLPSGARSMFYRVHLSN